MGSKHSRSKETRQPKETILPPKDVDLKSSGGRRDSGGGKPSIHEDDEASSTATKASAESEIVKTTVLDGKYTDLKLLGSGNFGKCYRAVSNVDDQVYAVKLIPCKTKKDLQNIKKEAKVLYSMAHAHITRYFSAFMHEQYFGVVMEFCSGGNLNDVVTKARTRTLDPPLTVRRVQIWTSQIAEALAYLASVGILHRDLKGDNVFLSADGLVKLADFGLAEKSSLVRGQAGAFAYESPEQAGNHRYGAPNDLWALGCIVTELATLKFVSERTKQAVFAHDAAAVIAAINEVASVDPMLGQICAGLLEANQNMRMRAVDVVTSLAPIIRSVATGGALLFGSMLGDEYTPSMRLSAPSTSHPGMMMTGGVATSMGGY